MNALSERYSEVVNVYKAVGGGWVDLADPLAPQSQPSSAAGQPAPAAAATATSPRAAATAAAAAAPASQDRTAVVQEGKTSVLNVYRERGIGGVEVRAPKTGWPPQWSCVFMASPGLESFTARTPTSFAAVPDPASRGSACRRRVHPQRRRAWKPSASRATCTR